MKSITFTIFCVFAISLSSQSQSNSYWSGGVDMIFSFADIDANGIKGDDNIRWAPVINLQWLYNTDLSENFGLFAGIGVSNVGYTYNDYEDPATGTVYKKKFRSYNLGVPLGIKYGEMGNWCLYAGYEFELPFAYKEKTFDLGDKTGKIVGFFSNRQNSFQHGPMFGVRLPKGGNIKFKYYITDFHNQDFTDSSGNQPYKYISANIWYISIGVLIDG